MNNDIGRRIRKIRISKGIDLKQLADEIGMRDTSVAKIERVGSNSVDTLRKIANALDVRIADLFEDHINAVAEPIENIGLYRIMEELLEKNKHLFDYVKSEFAKLNKAEPVKAIYTLKNKSRKPPKKK